MSDEVARLRRWIDELQAGMTVNCVYCGHCYGPRETTPVTMADALKAHVEQCPEHPMSKLKADNANMVDALEEIVKSAGFESGECEPALKLRGLCVSLSVLHRARAIVAQAKGGGR